MIITERRARRRQLAAVRAAEFRRFCAELLGVPRGGATARASRDPRAFARQKGFEWRVGFLQDPEDVYLRVYSIPEKSFVEHTPEPLSSSRRDREVGDALGREPAEGVGLALRARVRVALARRSASQSAAQAASVTPSIGPSRISSRTRRRAAQLHATRRRRARRGAAPRPGPRPRP